MEKLQFRCTLKSDVVLSASPATQGGGRTLDFIPGNAFLGIAASSLYDKEDEHTWLLFHSSHVRFGDAHPSIEGRRGLHVPAALYYPKLKSITEDCYVRYKTPETEAVKEMQLKQCRSGYYVFDDRTHTASQVKVEKDVAIKSAYDSEKLRSLDQHMFTYQALRKGLVMYFEVELDDEAAACRDELTEALTGDRHVGKSRSAEYGLVSIEKAEFPEPASAHAGAGGEREVAVYADGRLIFLDENCRPTFQPTADALGLKGGEILWDKSQIRSFQYAPWNYKRQAFGNDRCGIEKGSVIIVKTGAPLPPDGYVGSYRNEGFGKVLYDPSFLDAESDGHSVYHFSAAADEGTGHAGTPAAVTRDDSPLLRYLVSRSELSGNESQIMKDVNSFVDAYATKFRRGGEAFASQWGSIRNIAMVTGDSEELYEAVRNFVTHGVAKDKWEDRSRWDCLDSSIRISGHPRDSLQDFLINLSSEMAKICSNKE
ncbi:MAG: hypothetical protein SPL25_06535 [Succinivibrionaceae bacterium]|nr:hypothetical protein [Succinivibrionaceae bacterium]